MGGIMDKPDNKRDSYAILVEARIYHSIIELLDSDLCRNNAYFSDVY
jgi:hypothetical protein